METVLMNLPNYEPQGTRFKAVGIEMILALDEEPREDMRGWLFFHHPDGQWVPLRIATREDIAAINEAVSRAHHVEG